MKKLILLFTVLAFIGCKEEPKEKAYDYDDTTSVEGLRYLKHDNSLVTGTIKKWNDNGQLKHERTYKNGERDGINKSWYDNGQIRSEETFKDGTRDGVQKMWYENGQLMMEGVAKDGQVVSRKEYDDDGNEK